MVFATAVSTGIIASVSAASLPLVHDNKPNITEKMTR
jgi:hypothetical protein